MKIIIANTQKHFFQIMKIRSLVFVCEQGVDIQIEQDEADENATHWLVYNEFNQPIATCRSLIEENYVKIGRVAVLKNFRHQHIATQLMSSLAQYPPYASKILQVHAQAHAVDFYQKLGYTITSSPYFEAGIEHLSMEKQL